jgi:membrane protein implicated in regulation of membrane protease activity
MFGLFRPLKKSQCQMSRIALGRGTITEIVHPNHEWRISFNATYWYAHSDHPLSLQPGEQVHVLGHETATTLLISAIEGA